MTIPVRSTSGADADRKDVPEEDEGAGAAEPMGLTTIILLSLYLVLLAGCSVYVMFRIWPMDAPPTAGDQTGVPDSGGSQHALRAAGDSVAVFGVRMDFSPPHSGRRLLLIAMLAGGLGAFVSSSFSMARFLGKGQLARPWTLYYLLRPPSGMVLALLVYFLLRGGLLQPVAGADAVSPYGVAAFTGLIGMFVRQANDKLRDIADTMFATKAATQTGGDREPEGHDGEGRPQEPMTPEAVAAAHHSDPGA